MIIEIKADIFEKHETSNPFTKKCEDCMPDIWSYLTSEENITPKTYIFIEKVKDDEL